MAMQRSSHNPQGARRVEQRLGADEQARLAATVAALDPASCGAALQAAADCYRELRDGVEVGAEAEHAAMAFLKRVRAI